MDENINLLNDVIAKKIFTKNEYGKRYAKEIISEVLGIDISEKDIENIHPEIGINKRIVNIEADIVYKNEKRYINIEINYSQGNKRRKKREKHRNSKIFIKSKSST